MSFTNTHVVFICFAFLCILMGMQYTIYGGEENEFRNGFKRRNGSRGFPVNASVIIGVKRQVLKSLKSSEEMIARYEMANSEANEELISEIHILKDAINEINDKEYFNNATNAGGLAGNSCGLYDDDYFAEVKLL